MFTYPPKEQPDIESLKLAQSEQVRKHYMSVQSGVTIPLLQALVSAAAVSGLVGLLCLEFHWTVLWVPGCFLTVFVLVWWFRVSDWRQLIWNLELSLRTDINGDTYVGEPAEPETVRVELHSEDGRHTQFADIPCDSKRLGDLARGVLAGEPFSETAWSGAGALFSRNEFRQVREVFMSRGWLRWRDERYHEQGVELAPAGRAVLKVFASDTHSPTLDVRRS